MESEEYLRLEEEVDLLSKDLERLCQLERRALEENLYVSDLPAFENLIAEGEGVARKLSAARTKLIALEPKVHCPQLDAEIISKVADLFPSEETPMVLSELLALKVWYHVNQWQVFDQVALKILATASGDVDALKILVTVARRDWRDIIK